MRTSHEPSKVMHGVPFDRKEPREARKQRTEHRGAGVQQEGEQQLGTRQKREDKGATREDPREPRSLCPKTGTTLISSLKLISFFNVYDKQWRRKWQPTPIVLSGEIHGQRSPAGYSPWGHKESDTTERLTQYMTNKHSRYKFFNLHFILRKTLDLHWELN